MIEPCMRTWDIMHDRKSKLGVGMYITRRVRACEGSCPRLWCLDLGWTYPVFSNTLTTIPIYKNSRTVGINGGVRCHYRGPTAFSNSTLRFWWVTPLCFSVLLQSSFSLNEIQGPWVSGWLRSMPEKQHFSPWHLKKVVAIAALGSVLTFISHLNFWLRSCRTPCCFCTT